MVIREYLKRYNADEILFFLAVIFKPFYLLPSGSFQIGDFLFLAAIAVHFLAGGERDLLFPIHKEEHSLLIFVIGVLVINVTYWILIGSADFLLNSAYYIFNFLIVLFATDKLLTGRKDMFLFGLCNTCKIVMILQILVYFSGTGNSMADGRYTGTFNDPNQYAVYILFCMLIMLDLQHSMSLGSVFWFAIGIVLIVPSGSTGSLMGVAVFLGLLFIIKIVNMNKQKMLVGIAACLSLAALFVILQMKHSTTVSIDILDMMRDRLEDKLKNATSINDMLNYLIKDRVWNRVFEQPKYLLYGAGEGAHSRFDTRIVSHEIHSSILGPPFYYGIGISFFMFMWIWTKLRNIDAFQFCIYFALVTESIILVNYRQPLFWTLFVLAGRQKPYEKSVISSVNEPKHMNPVVIEKIN